MCVLLITRLLRGVGRWARKPVNHTSWVAVVTPTDRPKSVRNCCLIELFCGVVCVATLPLWHFCWYRGFCHRTGSDLLLFVLAFVLFVETSDILYRTDIILDCDIITGLNIITESDISPNIGFHGASATGVACQQGTLTPPDTWSCPTLGLACVLISRPISPELVLSPDFWISNSPRYFSFAYEVPLQWCSMLNYILCPDHIQWHPLPITLYT